MAARRQRQAQMTRRRRSASTPTSLRSTTARVGDALAGALALAPRRRAQCRPAPASGRRCAAAPRRRRSRPASADVARRRRGSLSRSSDRPSAWPKLTSRSISDARSPACTRVGFGGRGSRPGFLTLALLMEDEDDREDDQRRHQREPGAALDVARQIQEVADRLRETTISATARPPSSTRSCRATRFMGTFRHCSPKAAGSAVN